jgi:cellulose synthase/poly-beta-1,6-N-acetylglucosamine synthase-like glycosyltransferase
MQYTPIWWIFWGSLSIIVYSYVGFPLLVALRAWLWPAPVKRATHTPRVSVVLAAHNEAQVITRKLDNTLALNYPRECLEMVVASDGSDDDTADLVAKYAAPQVKLLRLPRGGKNRALNAAVAAARGEILVFTDADAMFRLDALRHLVAPFSDPQVGGVAGDYRHATNVVEGANERSYWDFERRLKGWQSCADSMTSAWGPIYAIRRSLFKPIPAGVTDDYFISAQVLAAHRRLIFEPRAAASGPVATSTQAEFRRKVRIISAGLRGVWEMRALLNPLEYGLLAVQVFSHKLLRRLMVIPLLLLGISAPALWQSGWFYRLITLGQLVLHGAAALGFLLRGTHWGQSKLLRLPFFFDMVYTAAAVALVALLRGARHDMWESGGQNPPGHCPAREREV